MQKAITNLKQKNKKIEENSSFFEGLKEAYLEDKKNLIKYVKQTTKEIIDKKDISLAGKIDLENIEKLGLLNKEILNKLEQLKIEKLKIDDILILLYQQETKNKNILNSIPQFLKPEKYADEIEKKDGKFTNNEKLVEIYTSKFEKGNNFLSRKFYFEHFLDENVKEIEFLDRIDYNEALDIIFYEFIKSEENNKVKGFLKYIKKIKENTQNLTEIKTVFNLVYWQIGYKENDISKILDNSLFILKYLRGRKFFLSDKIEKAIFYTIKDGDDINVITIKRHLETDIYIPGIFDSKFSDKPGEGLNIVKNITKKFRPELINKIDTEIANDKKIIESSTTDTKKSKTYKYIVKYLKKLDFLVDNKLVKFIKDNYKKITKKIGIYKENFCELKFNTFVRVFREDELDGIISKNKQKEYILAKHLFKKQLAGFKKEIKNYNGNIKTTENKSKLLDFILGKLKTKSLKPVFLKILTILNKKRFLAFFGPLIAKLKLKSIAILGMFSGVNYLNKKIKKTDFIKRASIIDELNDGHNFKFSPGILHFLAKNSEDINKIELNIQTLKEINKLRISKKLIQKKLKSNITENYYLKKQAKIDDELIFKLKKENQELNQELEKVNLQLKLSKSEKKHLSGNVSLKNKLSIEFYDLLEEQLNFLNGK